MASVASISAAPSPRPAPPEGDFVIRRRVPVFAAHRTRLRDGTPVVYDADALRRIVENCNRRIRETGSYAAVCIGHTDGSDDSKPLVGLAGPFYFEERDGRPMITADFRIFRDAVEELKRHPRPSPEVWIPADGFDPDRIFLDPIAMLGAQTPRLDLGMSFLYRARAGGLLCEKYAAVDAAPASVSVPTAGNDPDKEKYDMAALGPEDIQAVLRAIEATDWFAELQQMIAERRQSAANAGDQPPEPSADKPVPNAAEESGEQPENPEESPQQPESPSARNEEAPPAGPGPDAAPKRREEYRKRYARRSDGIDAEKEIYRLRQELEREKALRVDGRRRAELERLATSYVLDVDEEMALVRYGRAGDEEFARHLERIRKYYRPIPVEKTLPLWGEALAQDYPEHPESYGRRRREETAAQALAYAKEMVRQGRPISYDEAKAAVSGRK